MKDKIIDRLREEKYQLGIRKDAEHKAEVEMLKAEVEKLKKKNEGLKEYKKRSEINWGDLSEKFEGERDAWRWAEVEMWIEGLNEEIAELKAELLDINAKHHRDTQKTCLKARFDTWREAQVKYNSDYNMEDEAFWLVGEAINIQDAIEVFNELYEDGTGDDYTWRLECDHERNWEINQLYMDDEGEYTLTEEEWEAQNQEDNDPEEYGEYTWKQGLTAEEIAKGDTIDPLTGEEKVAQTEKKTCDFCENERKVLTKRDAGYDEWTCSPCHKEQYPEQYGEEQ